MIVTQHVTPPGAWWMVVIECTHYCKTCGSTKRLTQTPYHIRYELIQIWVYHLRDTVLRQCDVDGCDKAFKKHSMLFIHKTRHSGDAKPFK